MGEPETLSEILGLEPEESIRHRYRRSGEAWEAFADQMTNACRNADRDNPGCGRAGLIMGCGGCIGYNRAQRAVNWADGCCRQAIERALEDNARKKRMLDRLAQILMEHHYRMPGPFSSMVRAYKEM